MKTIVVGAGGGGIASALLAALEGHSVTLVEAHENIGGCASWFERGGFALDAGATTVSGIDASAPLGKLFKLLGDAPALTRTDPGIVFHLSTGETLRYFSDFDRWMRELDRGFPGKNHRGFWKKVYALNAYAWPLLGVLKSFPFKTPADFWEVLREPKFFALYPYLLVSTELVLRSFQLDDPAYLELVNGILLISAQAEAPQIPFLIGAMALAYPQETYAPVGGMKGLMEFFESKCRDLGVTLLKNTEVLAVSGKTVALSTGESLACDELILNLTYWDLPKLFSGLEREKLQVEFSEERVAWGAFAVYFVCRSEISEAYQQVHLNHPKVKNYFVSFGAPVNGEQTVTISTHVFVDGWEALPKSEYRSRKRELEALILDDFKRRFSVSSLKYLSSGTPKTYQRYTHRSQGRVGGLPFLYGMNPWKLKGHFTPLKGVYQVGDTTFPGQGLVGVVAGALSLREKLNSE